jgi:hypothetical protein
MKCGSVVFQPEDVGGVLRICVIREIPGIFVGWQGYNTDGF